MTAHRPVPARTGSGPFPVTGCGRRLDPGRGAGTVAGCFGGTA